ncbi:MULTISPECIES: hypothetical protein [unclassified Micromonospora]|uniref:hypothetical protein n=1 Tax=unclassified Micromonospora TaxID=2617518 RepID=UPI00098D35AF|nr:MULTISPECIES: hypothetical protein [unclassified Micromonospora]MDI5937328.1 hypothetical protein [Micromonospora sp. DH15]
MRLGRHPLLHSLDRDQLTAAAADQRWPKWSTMCQLRLLGNPVLNGVCVTPDADATALPAAVEALAAATGATKLMVRSDGGVETRAYYRGGNSLPIDQIEPHAADLLAAGRAVILLEPTNRFTNQLSALLRMDRPAPGKPGTFAVEVLGAGYDVGDLTRGGIRPQVSVSIAGVTWHHYDEPWWADLHVTRDLSPKAEHARRQARLARLAPHIRTITGPGSLSDSDEASAAAEWLRTQGHVDLWRDSDPTQRVIRSVREWFEVAFLIALHHPNRNWRCLATSLSDLGARRTVYWDVVDAARKYATPDRRIV